MRAPRHSISSCLALLRPAILALIFSPSLVVHRLML